MRRPIPIKYIFKYLIIPWVSELMQMTVLALANSRSKASLYCSELL